MLHLRPHRRLRPVLCPLHFVDAILIAVAPLGAVLGLRRALPDYLALSAIGLIAHTRVSSPCNRSGSTAESATLAAVATAVWMIFVLLSTPTCAFIPKYHCLPFFVWCISGSRCCSRFLVEVGACRMVASTIVPVVIRTPCACRCRFTCPRICSPSWC